MPSDESNSSAPNLSEPRAVFVCVRNRHGKGASCAGRGSRDLVEQMRALLVGENIGPEELAVRPCGCLGLCKQGPVMLAVAGEAALCKHPRKPGKREAGVHTRVKPGGLREILRDALLGPA